MKRLLGSIVMTGGAAALLAFTPGFAASGGKASKAGASRPHRSCVLRSTLAGPIVRDDGGVYFRGQPDRRKSYIAVFKGDACRKLNPLASLSLETGGDLVCEGDRVRAVMSASQIPGPACIVDHLVPFSGDVDDPVPADLPE